MFLLALLPASQALASAQSPAVTSIAAANSTSVALMDDGTVWQWGYYGGSVDWATPQKIPIDDVKQVAVGDNHVLALKTDGTVWAWGSNDYGQLGQGSMNYAGSPVPVQVSGLEGITAISAGGSHCLALESNGVVWAWGENAHGILGDGTDVDRYAPEMSEINNVLAFDAGDSGHALAVKSDGTVWAWGFNYMGQLGEGGESLHDQGILSLGPDEDNYNPDMVRGIANAVAVAAGGAHSVALDKNGTVWAWGSNSDGQLGIGTVGGSDLTSPAPVPGLNGVKAIAAGMYYTLALDDNGTVWAWGSNGDGEIGNASATSTATPVQVLIGPQVTTAPSPTPLTPVIARTSVTPVPSRAGSNNLILVGAAGLVVIIIIIAALAYILASGKKGKRY